MEDVSVAWLGAYKLFGVARNKKLKMENKICPKVIRENLNRVNMGYPLTLPLRELNESCEFRKEYHKIMETDKEIRKEYSQRPEVKEKRRRYMKEYNQRPEVKEKMRRYNQRPEVKARMKIYNQRPEVKERKRKYYQKNKEEINRKRREKYREEKET